VYLTVRWSSALPIRQALALERWGRSGLNAPAAIEWLNQEPKEHLVEVFGLPAIMATNGAKRIEEDLSRSCVLWLKSRLPSRAASVHVPEHGTHLSAELRFLRASGITPQDGAVELRGETGPIQIAQKFKLREMVYQGRLEW
jgi:hypothetical protein